MDLMKSPIGPVVHFPLPYDPSDNLRLWGDMREPGYYSGSTGNDWITWNNDPNFNYRDVVYGGGGFDYINTGGGNDKIVLGSNAGTWTGDGNWTGKVTQADASNGNDDIIVSGRTGDYIVTTGEGQDDVIVDGMYNQHDRIRIVASDADGQRDTFTFGANFNGTAEIWGIDAHDALTLKGGDWRYDAADGRYENSTGGSVTLSGVTHGYNDPDVFFL